MPHRSRDRPDPSLAWPRPRPESASDDHVEPVRSGALRRPDVEGRQQSVDLAPFPLERRPAAVEHLAEVRSARHEAPISASPMPMSGARGSAGAAAAAPANSAGRRSPGRPRPAGKGRARRSRGASSRRPGEPGERADPEHRPRIPLTLPLGEGSGLDRAMNASEDHRCAPSGSPPSSIPSTATTRACGPRSCAPRTSATTSPTRGTTSSRCTATATPPISSAGRRSPPGPSRPSGSRSVRS